MKNDDYEAVAALGCIVIIAVPSVLTFLVLVKFLWNMLWA